MTNEKRRAVLELAAALYLLIFERVKGAGELGAPSGELYALVMPYGVSLALYETMMSVLVESKKVTRRGLLYFTTREKRA